MKVVAVMLLIFAFIGNATAGLVRQPHDCCPDEQCQLVDCISMGCMPGAVPALPTAQPMCLPSEAVQDWTPHALKPSENQVEEVWAPPD